MSVLKSLSSIKGRYGRKANWVREAPFIFPCRWRAPDSSDFARIKNTDALIQLCIKIRNLGLNGNGARYNFLTLSVVKFQLSKNWRSSISIHQLSCYSKL